MADHNRVVLELPDEAATRAFGATLAPLLRPAMKIYLRGDLGSGKTTLAQAILAALGHRGRVKSPTYTLVEHYTLSRLHLYHFDFYRFRDAHEWREAGFSDYFGGDAVCLVEWPEKAGDELPEPDLEVSLEIITSGVAAQPASRRAVVIAHSAQGSACVTSLADSPTRARFS